MHRIFLVVVVLLILELFATPANAILNIEVLREKLEGSDSVGVLGVSFDRKEGNSDALKWLVQAQALTRKNEVEWLLAAEREFGQSNGKYDTNRRMEHLRVTWPETKPLALEAYTQEEQNQFQRLTSRVLAGGGFRRTWVETKDLKLHTGAGAFFSHEILESAPGTADAGTEDLWRANLYVSFVVPLSEQASASSVTYYQPALRTLEDARILNSSQVTTALTHRLSLTVSYTLAYDSRPPQNVQMADQEYATIVNLKF